MVSAYSVLFAGEASRESLPGAMQVRSFPAVVPKISRNDITCGVTHFLPTRPDDQIPQFGVDRVIPSCRVSFSKS